MKRILFISLLLALALFLVYFWLIQFLTKIFILLLGTSVIAVILYKFVSKIYLNFSLSLFLFNLIYGLIFKNISFIFPSILLFFLVSAPFLAWNRLSGKNKKDIVKR